MVQGPKFQGRTHRLLGLLATVAVVMMIPSVTDAAVSNNILTSYFENLAQGYKDYGFVYSFLGSVRRTGACTHRMIIPKRRWMQFWQRSARQSRPEDRSDGDCGDTADGSDGDCGDTADGSDGDCGDTADGSDGDCGEDPEGGF